MVGGACRPRRELAEPLAFHQNASGAIAGPFDAWLTLRGLRRWRYAWTGTRQRRGVVEFLTGHPTVTQVLYPGLARPRDMSSRRGRCGALAGWCASGHGSEEEAVAVCARTQVFMLGESSVGWSP